MHLSNQFFVPEPLVIFGLISAALSTVAYLPYMRDILVGQTRPQRASWFIWSVLGSIAFFSQLYEGATHSLLFVGVQVSSTIVIFALSLWRGVGGLINRQDALVLLMASLGLLAWYFTHNAVYALAITIAVSLLGGVVTIRKAYRMPSSETLPTWVCSGIASAFAILTVGHFDWVLLAYPLYLLALNGAIVVAILRGRTRMTAFVAGE